MPFLRERENITVKNTVRKVSGCTHLEVTELEAGHSVLEKWTMLKMGRTERGFEP